jgi:hypothetical protein
LNGHRYQIEYDNPKIPVNITPLTLTIIAAIWTFAVAVTGWFVGNSQAKRRESASKRAHFRSFVKNLRAFT